MRYSEGEWLAVVTRQACALLPAGFGREKALEVWRELGVGHQFPVVLQKLMALTQASLTDLPSFAIVIAEAPDWGDAHVAVRGPLTVSGRGATGEVKVTGENVTTWREERVTHAQALRLAAMPAEPRGSRMADANWWPILEGIVWASVLDVIDSVDDTTVTRQNLPEAPVVAQYPAAAAPASISSTTLLPEVDDDKCDLHPAEFSANVLGAQPVPVNAVPGLDVDHDGMTTTGFQPSEDDHDGMTILGAPTSEEDHDGLTVLGGSASDDHDGLTVYGGPAPDDDHDGMTVLGLPGGQSPAGAPPPPPPPPPPALTEGPSVLARTCLVCGAANPTQLVVCRRCGAQLGGDARRIPRPSLGTLVLPSGERLPIEHPVVVGRRPEATRFSGDDVPIVVRVDDPHISSTHLKIDLEDWSVLVTNLGLNGTVLRRPGQPDRAMGDGETVLAQVGDLYDIGSGATLGIAELA